MKAVAMIVLLASAALAGCGAKHEEAPHRAPSAPVLVSAPGQIDPMRRGVPIDADATPPAMARVENFDRIRPVNYEMQPPTIPHSIDNYQLTRNTNRCMLCHTRSNAQTFLAPPVSPAHYATRDGTILEEISPRRYFCVQCHVVQTDAQPLIANRYEGLNTTIPEGGVR
ncbi:MAG: nitrate reductase cytochrome c-type subunit [Dokdonella sp.]|nr:nitrate reductase cytochrome c-type subunit [Dokdonella sp.]